MLEDVALSVASAIAGFALAVASGVVRLGWQWQQRPVLEITVSESAQFLSHGKEVGSGDIRDEKIYGFSVKNTGRSIATNVKFQLLKIEIQKRGDIDFRLVMQQTFDLRLFVNSYMSAEYKEITLVPGATAEIKLASSIEDAYDVVCPAVEGWSDYYEEITGNCERYRFRVVAFADGVKYVVKDIVIDN